MSTETEIRELINQLGSQVSESKKRLAELKNKFVDEETKLIGLTLKLEEQQELLRRQSGSIVLKETEEKNNQIDAAFKEKLGSLLTSVK